MEITIENLELSIDSDVLFDEIRDDITAIIEDVVDSAVRDAMSDHVPDAVSEELRWNFDIEDHIDYERVVDEVNRANDGGSAETAGILQQLNDPDVVTALRALMTPKVLAEVIESLPIRELMMHMIADQLLLGQAVSIESTER